MQAPINLVLPIPVASAKQNDGKSLSKLLSVGNKLCTASSSALRSGVFDRVSTSHNLANISTLSRCGLRSASTFSIYFE